MVMTPTCTKTQIYTSVGSKDRVEINELTLGRIDVSRELRSVRRKSMGNQLNQVQPNLYLLSCANAVKPECVS